MKLAASLSGALLSLVMTMSAQAAQEQTPSATPIEATGTPSISPTSEPAQPPIVEPTTLPVVETTTTVPPSAMPSPAFSPKVQDAIGVPPEGKALVVFFRPSKFMGGGIRFIVREGEAELGKLSSGTYFTEAVEPGKHTYVVHSEAKDLTNVEVESGETYFLSGSISMGFMVGRPNLSPSDAAAFETALPKMKKAAPLK